MGEEARDILRTALAVQGSSSRDLVRSIREHFEPLGGVELKLAPRDPVREPPDLRR